jgi:cytosine/adenosine deaminase-related metal-dependent hydrolase
MGDVMTPNGLLQGGHVVIRKGSIACVGCDCKEQGKGATQVSCPGALITPGLINPHDHLGWAELPPIPHGDLRYDHRNEWRKGKNGKKKLSTPKNSSSNGILLGELRMVMSGVTSMMGSGGKDGLTRNLDSGTKLEGLSHGTPDTPTFPLGDIDGKIISSGCGGYKKLPDAAAAAAKVAYIPHLAEGVSEGAHNEFLCISGQADGAVDAVFNTAAFIHGIGLTSADIALMADDFAGLIWSPRSNVSLYGFTADVVTYARMGVQIALGTDWVPSGSMNMTRELACADYLNKTHYDGYFSDRRLVEMVTQTAAELSGFGDVLGVLQEGFAGDVAVFDGRKRSNYRALIDAGVEDVVLVLRGGYKLYGDAHVIGALPSTETCDSFDVCGRKKQICMAKETGMTLDALLADVHSNDSSYVSYDLYFCGPPEDEPTCIPSRPGEYTGVPTESDPDGDGIPTEKDNCPTVFNPPRPLDKGAQTDADGDKAGDACDVCPFNANTENCSSVNPDDLDADGVDNVLDNCPQIANPEQSNQDGDRHGDACDKCPEHADPCPSTVYAIKRGELAEGSEVSLPPMVVTAVASTGYYLQHPPGSEGDEGAEYSGIFVYDAAGVATLKVADTVRLTATTDSFYGQIQLQKPTISIETTQLTMPEPALIDVPLEVATGGAKAAQFEGVLIRVQNVTVTNIAPVTDEPPPSNEYEVADGLLVDDVMHLTDPVPSKGAVIKGITGILYWGWNNTKLAPRSASDLELGAPQLQSISPALVYMSEGQSGSSNPPLMVSLSWPAEEAFIVTLSSSDPAVVVPVSAELVIPKGATSAEIILDAPSSSTEPVTIDAQAGDVTVSALVRVVGLDEVAVVTGAEPAQLVVAAEKTTKLQLNLDLPAPEGGQIVWLEATPEGIVTVPESVDVPAGQFTILVDVTALEMPGESVLTATTVAGAPQLSVPITVTEKVQVGLLISELMYDPPGGDDELEWVKLYNGLESNVDVTGYKLAWGGTDYGYGHVFLSGVIPAGGCFLVGGPKSDETNGVPIYDQEYNFEPDIQNSGPIADAVALFVDDATMIDSVIYGGENTNALVDKSGEAGAVDVGKAPKGSSLIRVDAQTWGYNNAPNADACPAIQ